MNGANSSTAKGKEVAPQEGAQDKAQIPLRRTSQSKPKRNPTRPTKTQPKIGRLLNLQIPPKQAQFKTTSRPKQAKGKGVAQRAGINLSPEGFYEVEVEYDHCAEISRGCGIQPTDVFKALDEDNLQRRLIPLDPIDEEDTSQGSRQEGPVLEFDSDEDGMSEEEIE